jgi:glycosyltransferase involved in cell wall biosynthesis
MSKGGERFAVLHINTERGMRGGEIQTLGLALRLPALGFPGLVAARPGGVLLEKAQASGLPTAPLGLSFELDLRAAAGLRRLARETGARILHAHTAHALTPALLAARGDASLRVVASRRVSFPLRSRLSLWKYRRASAVVAVSEEVRTGLVAQGLAPERIRVIHSGVDLARFEGLPSKAEARARWGLPAQALVVGVVGALVPHKGHAVLLEAAARVSERGLPVVLVAAGEGELRVPLANQAERLGVEVRWLGYVKEPAALYPAMDCLAVPSVSGEGSPGTLKEATAAGVAVVATEVGGAAEILRPGKEVVLVPPGDPGALAEGLLRLLEDGELRLRLGAAGRARIAEFSMDRMAQAHARLYGELLARS